MGWQFEIHHVPGNPFDSLEYVDGISMSAVLEAIRTVVNQEQYICFLSDVYLKAYL